MRQSASARGVKEIPLQEADKAADAEYPDVFTPRSEAGKGLHQCGHRGIVGPDATVEKCVTPLLEGREVRWRRGRRSSHRTHPFIAVKGIARVVRGLEDIDLSVMTLRRRNQKAVLDPLSVLSPRL